jgi:DNA-binding transcriptional regulator YdaS (Cro superfamily)
MNLRTYLQNNTQASLARAIGVTPGAVSQWVNGQSLLTAKQAVLIEQATNGLVRCEELLPDIPWSVLRSKPALPASATQPEAQEA